MKFRSLLFLLSLIINYPTFSADLFVSPLALTGGDGTIESPFASLEDARKAALDLVGKETVIIWLMDGTYYLDQPLVLGPQDGGSLKFPVYYRALNEGRARISGGSSLELKWKPFEGGIFVADVPEGLHIDQLFVNRQRKTMARFPNAKPGYNVFDCWTLSHSAEPDPEHDPLSREKVAEWSNPQGAYLHAMHRALWGGMHYRVIGKTDEDILELEGGWQNNRPDRMHQSYRFIEHVFEELDTPGEWYHDRDRAKLYYYPAPDEDLQGGLVEIVSLRHLLEFQGSMEDPVRHIHLEGMVFMHTARTFMENQEPLLRSDWTTYRGGALFFNGAENCSVSHCEFDQLGGNSVFVNNYNRNIHIISCHIHESGANGIAFVGDPEMVRNPIFRYGPQDYKNMDLTPGPKGNNYPSGCLVYDCLIERTGRTEKQTAPVQISMSHRITVSHCSIYDVPRAGINISEGTFGGHVIEYCDVFNTVLETGDHGSFNSWGRDRFWDPDIPTMNREVANNPRLPYLDMVEPNIIRNSRWRCDHGWDIDLDDGSTQYQIYNNLLLNGGLKLREGYHRKVWNNIVVNNGLHPHVWPSNNGDVITRNIFFTSHKAIAMNRGMDEDEKWGKEIDYNVFTSSQADRMLFANNDCDLHSIVADPGFRDPESGDFSVALDGAVEKLGFRNFNMTNFGVLSPHLRAIVKTPEMPDVEINPDTAGAAMQPLDISIWKDAQLIEPRGHALSAYGVAMDAEGVALAYVPEFSGAWNLGFRSGDFITEIDEKKPVNTGIFIRQMKAGAKHHVRLVRNQEVRELEINQIQAQTTTINKVLIVGIDGCRPDALLMAHTPNMDALWKNGAFSFNAITDEISSSGPAWSAMLIGAWHQKHNILNNDYEDPDLENYPHFFHRIRQEKPEMRTYSVANWGPIHKILQEGDATYTDSPANDKHVASKVASILKSQDVDVMFVQLDEVDGAGHKHDYTVASPKYLEAIEIADQQVGEIVSALEKRKTYGQENWLIIVSADHGGSNFGHGKNIPEHTTVFYMAAGESAVKGEIEQEVGVVDVAVTALYHLGIPVKPEWNLDGHVAGLK